MWEHTARSFAHGKRFWSFPDQLSDKHLQRTTAHKGSIRPRIFEAKQVRVCAMLRWALIFLVIALIAAVLGFSGIAGAAAGMAKILFGLFLLVCAILFLIGLFASRKV